MESTPEQTLEPIYLVMLRAFIYGVAVFVLIYGLALGAGLMGGVLGAMTAVGAAAWMSVRKVRGAVFATVAVSAVVAGQLASGILTGTGIAASVIGIEDTLSLTDFLVFGLTLFGVALGLRAMAARWEMMAVVEVGFIVAGVVRLVSGHRDHAISEPRFLSDWVWSQGGDPIVALLAVGALTLATVPMLLLVRQRLTKAILSVAVLLFVGLGAFAYFKIAPPDPPDPTGGLGLTGNPEEGEETEAMPGDGTGQGQRGDDDPTEMPFKDDYPQGQPKPVAIVLLHDDYTAPAGYLYFRQTAFSQFNGYRLVKALVKDADPDLIEHFPSRLKEVSDLDREYRKFTSLETTVALITDHKQPFGLNNPLSFEPIPNPNPGTFKRGFKVESLAPKLDYRDMLDYDAGDPEWSDELRRLYTQPPDDPRYKELADKLVVDLQPKFKASPIGQALAIRRWLEKNTVYTRRSNHAGAQDPTASFLFGSKRGYCVHLAHAQAFLMRSRGIPARVSAGYLVDEARRASGSTVLIQNQDAHAWAELYLDGLGWVVMDVAPEQSEDAGGQPINQDLQRALGELARGDDSAGKKVGHDKRWKLGRIAAFGFGLLLFGVLGLGFGIKLWRRFIHRFAADRHLYRLTYRAALDRLAEIGLSREYGESREAFATRAAREVPALEPLTRAHLRRALGGAKQLDRAAWMGMLADVNKQIAGRFPLWRRLLGFLNPLSWIRVR